MGKSSLSSLSCDVRPPYCSRDVVADDMFSKETLGSDPNKPKRKLSLVSSVPLQSLEPIFCSQELSDDQRARFVVVNSRSS